jgi:hypothetical protein
MQYMLLVYDDPNDWNVAEDQMPAIYEEYAAVARDRTTKHSAQLTGAETAKTVRVKAGETLVTDGPFAETKEKLGGYYLVEAGSIEDAAKLAAKIPSARLGGSVEVRQVLEM